MPVWAQLEAAGHCPVNASDLLTEITEEEGRKTLADWEKDQGPSAPSA